MMGMLTTLLKVSKMFTASEEVQLRVGRTSTVEARARVGWTIDDFASLVKTANYENEAKSRRDGKPTPLHLNDFIFEVKERLQFKLMLQANPDHDKKCYDYGIFLKEIGNYNNKNCFVEFNMATKEARGQLKWAIEKNLSKSLKIFQTGWGFTKLLNDLLHETSLIVVCEIKVIRSQRQATEITWPEARIEKLQRPLEALGSDLKNALRKAVTTDVRLVCEGAVIHASSFILKARSKVFEAMLTHDMKEKRDNKIDIEDIRFEVMDAFIEFLHTDHFDYDNEMALDLLIAAEKYDVQILKYECEKSLLKNFDEKNAFGLLEQADLHNAEQLKEASLDSIVGRKNFEDTKEFKDLEKRNSHLALAILKHSRKNN